MGVVKGAIEISNNMSAVLRTIKQEQASFRADVVKTKKTLQDTWDKKRTAKLDTASATQKAGSLIKRITPLRKKISTVVAVKDMASAKISSVVGKVKSAGKMVASPVIKLKDSVSSGISKIGGKIKSLAKSVVIPVTVAATIATAALGGAVSSGMQLEQQQVSMEHFVGATNKGMSKEDIKQVTDGYISQLRDNANATPFETGDVISAGSRAISVAGGNTKEAMSLVKLSEDMAAASGGTKSISDAMEALADAKMGETERLKEFGFKVSAEEFDAKGFGGVAGDLQDFYGGAAEKLATTGAGLLSTIKGKMKSTVADMGLKIVDNLKPAFEGIIGIIDKVSPVMEKFGGNIASKIGQGVQAVTAILPSLVSGFQSIQPVLSGFIGGFASMLPSISQFGGSVMAAVQQVTTAAMPAISTIISSIQTVLPSVLPVMQTVVSTVATVLSGAAPVIAGWVSGISTVITTLAPVFQTIFSGIASKVGSVIAFVGERMGFIQGVISSVAPLISDILTTAWSVISPVMDIVINTFELIFSVVQRVFPGVQRVIQTVWNIIKPIVEGVGSVLGAIGNGIGWLAGKLGVGGSGGGDVGANAEGTNHWRGGATWVGEKGPELINLPRGSRVLPNKESVSLAQSAARPQAYPMPVPTQSRQSYSAAEKSPRGIVVTIAKLADSIIVREDADIDRIGEAIAKRVVLAATNMA